MYTNRYRCLQLFVSLSVGLCHPCTTTADGKFLPDFRHRYLREDIPYGLVVVKGAAQIAGVKTPAIDDVITWAQASLGGLLFNHIYLFHPEGEGIGCMDLVCVCLSDHALNSKTYASDLGYVFAQVEVYLWLSNTQIWSGLRSGSSRQIFFSTSHRQGFLCSEPLLVKFCDFIIQ